MRRIAPALAFLVTASFAVAKPLRGPESSIGRDIERELAQVPRFGPFAPRLEVDPEALSAKELARYGADYVSLAALKKELAKEPGKLPLRWATLEAFEALRQAETVPIELQGSALTPQEKSRVFELQKKVGQAMFLLQETLQDLEDAAASRAREPSPRWRAHFDYVHMACCARLGFLSEYNLALGERRYERVPNNGGPGWRIVAVTKPRLVEAKCRQWHRQTDELLDKLMHDYPGTPWAESARRDRSVPRGLAWQLVP